ncbi:MAG: twin-arginine translocase subunit TatC, partial [Deltaproteobacteria bacterium]|nr:twin-arginine translocase subunit TatC [Deltaproteobacteria bacterium]
MTDVSEMSFLAHLKELRTRIVAAACGIGLASCFTLWFATQIFGVLREPMVKYFEGVQLIGTGPAEAFIIKLKVGLVAGLFVSLPHTFLQVWKFVAPGMHEHERKYAIPFIIATTMFFLL